MISLKIYHEVTSIQLLSWRTFRGYSISSSNFRLKSSIRPFVKRTIRIQSPFMKLRLFEVPLKI